MPVVVVNGSESRAGTTTVAVGLAHRLAYAGYEVHLERLAFGANAPQDAATFGLLDFASSSGTPVQAGAVPLGGGVTILDASASPDAATLVGQLGATRIEVALPGVQREGPSAISLVNHARAMGPLQIPEDRLLAAPMVATLVEASQARVLARSLDGERAICEHIVVGAISHDSDQPYFARFPRKAVVTRAEKVDVALSALRTEADCLILTGGSDPSPYLLDRVAASRRTTLLVAPEGTVETVRDIEGTFGRAPFGGEAKIERIGALMAGALDDEALTRVLGA